MRSWLLSAGRVEPGPFRPARKNQRAGDSPVDASRPPPRRHMGSLTWAARLPPTAGADAVSRRVLGARPEREARRPPQKGQGGRGGRRCLPELTVAPLLPAAPAGAVQGALGGRPFSEEGRPRHSRPADRRAARRGRRVGTGRA